MPTRTYEWGPADHAASMIIDEMMTSRKLSNLGVDKKTNHQIAYSRLRDIRNGLKAPVRMSEFLLICDVCGADPVQALRDIIAEAARIRAGRDSPASANTLDLSDDEARIAETKRILAEDPMSLAAYHDPDKQHYIDGDGLEAA